MGMRCAANMHNGSFHIQNPQPTFEALTHSKQINETFFRRQLIHWQVIAIRAQRLLRMCALFSSSCHWIFSIFECDDDNGSNRSRTFSNGFNWCKSSTLTLRKSQQRKVKLISKRRKKINVRKSHSKHVMLLFFRSIVVDCREFHFNKCHRWTVAVHFFILPVFISGKIRIDVDWNRCDKCLFFLSRFQFG